MKSENKIPLVKHSSKKRRKKKKERSAGQDGNWSNRNFGGHPSKASPQYENCRRQNQGLERSLSGRYYQVEGGGERAETELLRAVGAIRMAAPRTAITQLFTR